MYTYKFDKSIGPVNVKTGFVTDMNDVKVEVIEKRDNFLHTVNTYPNGYILETKQWADRIEVLSSHPIDVAEDGTLFVNMNR